MSWPRFLPQHGIETRPFFIPIHTLPPYIDRRPTRSTCRSRCRLAASGLNLPTFSQMTDDQVDAVCEAIATARR